MPDGKLLSFNEGLTEITTRQILRKKYLETTSTAYRSEMLFIEGLVHDIAEKLNGKDLTALANEKILSSEFFGEKIRLSKERESEEKFRLWFENLADRLGIKKENRIAISKVLDIEVSSDEEPDLAEKNKGLFTDEEILGYFQTGMFNGDRKCLKIIYYIYGKEKWKALIHMGTAPKQISELALDFGLNETAKKIMFTKQNTESK